MSQIQCPNCGGFKTKSKKEDMKEEMPITREDQRRVMAWLALITIIAFLGVTAAQGVKQGTLAALIALVGFGFIYLYETDGGTRKVQKVGKGFLHTCMLCGYKWWWNPGDPKPQVTVRPELIQKGAQRLEEEKEKERKRQEIAAHYLHQHRKKK